MGSENFGDIGRSCERDFLYCHIFAELFADVFDISLSSDNVDDAIRDANAPSDLRRAVRKNKCGAASNGIKTSANARAE